MQIFMHVDVEQFYDCVYIYLWKRDLCCYGNGWWREGTNSTRTRRGGGVINSSDEKCQNGFTGAVTTQQH